MPKTTPTLVTVQGIHEIHEPPQRATVRLSAGFEGPDQSGVAHRTTALAERISADIVGQFSRTAGPVTWWSAETIRTWTTVPQDKNGKRLPPVFHASVALSVKFADFTALALWLGRLTEIEGVHVGAVQWALTEARRAELATAARLQAVRSAVSKAEAYAQALGLVLGDVIEVADPGMLRDGGQGASSNDMASYRTRGTTDAGILMKPENQTITSRVDVRFAARKSPDVPIAHM